MPAYPHSARRDYLLYFDLMFFLVRYETCQHTVDLLVPSGGKLLHYTKDGISVFHHKHKTEIESVEERVLYLKDGW